MTTWGQKETLSTTVLCGKFEAAVAEVFTVVLPNVGVQYLVLYAHLASNGRATGTFGRIAKQWKRFQTC